MAGLSPYRREPESTVEWRLLLVIIRDLVDSGALAARFDFEDLRDTFTA